MKHRIGFNRLSRKASNRKALLKNMVLALFTYERITTTKAKALAVRQVAEKMITRAKADNVHNRRIIGKRITEQGILAKLFTDIGPRNLNRPGGYTRIYKIGARQGDAAEMVILELVERKESDSKDEEAKAAKSETKASKAEAKAEKAPKKPAAKKAAEGEKPAKATKASNADEAVATKKPRAKKAEVVETPAS